MKLVLVDIQNYRSIKRASFRPSSGTTTIIGANNEGKSNILRAIRLGLSILEDVQKFQLRRTRGSIRVRDRAEVEGYFWQDDFPISAQTNLDGKSILRFELELSHRENEIFLAEFGIKTNRNIPVKLIFGRRLFEIDIPKQGPRKADFQAQNVEIAKFLSRRLRFVYIPPIRTAANAQAIVDSIISRTVYEAEYPILQRVQEDLDRAKRKAFKEISSQLVYVLGSFIPSINEVQIIEHGPSFSTLGRRSSEYELQLDDGSLTSLGRKGDGVQSMATMALMRGLNADDDRNYIFAIEEPEAHLHSSAIYQVRNVVEEGRGKNQILITTHSAIFVQRRDISSNIIVEGSAVRVAKSTEEIRTTLGIEPPENLISASMVVLCEGQSDCDFLRSRLSVGIPQIEKLLGSGELRLVDIDGAGSLSYHVKHHLGLATQVFAFLDNDDEGRTAALKAIDSGLLTEDEIQLTASSVRSDSELEDMLPPGKVNGILAEQGIKVDVDFEKGKARFSIRLKKLLKKLGKLGSDDKVFELKKEIWKQLDSMGKIEDEATLSAIATLQNMVRRNVR